MRTLHFFQGVGDRIIDRFIEQGNTWNSFITNCGREMEGREKVKRHGYKGRAAIDGPSDSDSQTA